MKIIDEREKEAHKLYVLTEGAKGLFYGGVLSFGVYAYLKHRHPLKFKNFNTSIKTCILTMPTIGMAAFWADQGSIEFDRKMYLGEYQEGKLMEEYNEWKKLSLSDKAITVLNDNKYKIIITSWAASMYGSWVFVNRDKIMTTAQKAVQARMYAQAITIVLLLSTIFLAMKEDEMNKNKPAPVPEWKRIVDEREAEKLKVLSELKKRESSA